MPFIYKITNTVTNKCYIGETVQKNPNNRWMAHKYRIKCGKGCPALRDAVNKHGIDNFTFEIIRECTAEERHDLEVHYIKEFNSQVPNGYNILPGGQKGFSRLGIKHSPETKAKLSVISKQLFIDNPNRYETYREKHQEAMKKVDISAAMSNSEKFKTACKEGRVGAAGWKTIRSNDELIKTSKKTSNSLKEYFKCNPNSEPSINIKKHREAMTKAVGRPIIQYSPDYQIIARFDSICDAGRLSGVSKGNIQHVIAGRTKTAGGFIWKYAEE
jgi:group I intron endonuclease